MSRASLLHDPEIADKIAGYMAMGIPHGIIARAYGVAHNTVPAWKKNNKFARILAEKLIALGKDPIEALRKDYPKDWLERHPEYREVWAKPTELQAKIALGFKFQIEYVNREARGLPEPEIVEVEGQEQGKFEHKTE